MARSGIHFDRSFRARLFNWHVRFVEYDDSLPTHSPCRWLNGFTRKWTIYMYIWWIREILVDFAQNSINKFSFKIGFSKICSRWIREDFRDWNLYSYIEISQRSGNVISFFFFFYRGRRKARIQRLHFYGRTPCRVLAFALAWLR